MSVHAQLPDPLLYYSFDEADGALTAVDGAGNGYDGNVNGGVTFGETGAPGGSTPGGAARFTGGWLDVTTFDVPSLLGKRDGTPEQADISYTMAAWISPDAVSLGGDRFFVGQTTQGIHNGLRNNGRLHQAHWGNDHYGNTILSADEWVHATFVYDGVNNQGTIYLNGVQDSPPQAKDGPNGSGTLIIGSRQANQGPYNGLIDDLVIYDQILTDEQIGQLADGISPVDVSDDDNDGLPDNYEFFIVGDEDLTILGGPENDAESYDADLSLIHI